MHTSRVNLARRVNVELSWLDGRVECNRMKWDGLGSSLMLHSGRMIELGLPHILLRITIYLIQITDEEDFSRIPIETSELTFHEHAAKMAELDIRVVVAPVKLGFDG